MPTLFYVLIGAVIGGATDRFPGAIFGACVGWLMGSLTELREKFAALEKEITWLRRKLAEHAQRQEKVTAEATVPMAAAPGFEPVQAKASPPVKGPVPAAQTVPKPEPTMHHPRQVHVADEPSRIMDAITNFFTGGNLLVKLGIVILFFGVSFLVKYAAAHGHFPIELRLVLTAMGGLALLGTGWRLRDRRAEYALALQGGGIGILFLTTYAAFRLFALLSPTASFILLVAISGLCGTLAVVQSSRTLALFGISGGFIAPLLASIGTGSPAFLFGYYAVLNAIIVGIAWYRSWRSLNLAGFAYTFVLGSIWGAQFYRPSHFATVEPFLILFFLIYVGIAILFAFRQPPELKGIVDGTLVFGTPIAAFALQAELVDNFRYGLAWSALAAGMLYLFLYLFLSDDRLRTLADAFLTFGAVFLTLAVPLAFDGRWTSAAWAVEGAALIWVGFRQKRQLARALGIILQFAGGIAFIADLPSPTGHLPILNGLYLGGILISMAGLLSSWTIRQHQRQARAWEQPLGHLLTAWGLIWWFAGGLHEIHLHTAADLAYGFSLVFVTASCLACHFMQRRLSWQDLSYPPLLLLPAMVCFLLPDLPRHPLAHGGWFAWPAAFAAHWWLLYQQEDELQPINRTLLHGGAVWLAAYLATWELGWQVHFFFGKTGSWLTISRGIVVIIMLAGITSGKRSVWPLRKHEELYLGIVALPLAVVSLCWAVIVSLGCSGDPWPFPWLPILNPLDLAIVTTFTTLLLWIKRLLQLPHLAELVDGNRTVLTAAGSLTIFIWLNSILARALHHWSGIPFTPEALLHSGLAQTAFAIFWSLLALCTMVTATRRGLRAAWLAGAALLGMAVLKLFLVDLAGHGTVERIVSFVAVGLLLLVIGWFSPVPPHREEH